MAPRRGSPRWIDALAAAVLAVVGLAVGLHYARMGYMPLDHSSVFDGGWRTLSGQVPFRDYHAPSGIVPALMQAPFFALFGVTWFAYCLHAAVLNGLFAALTYGLLVRLELARIPAAIYGLLGSLVLYPPFGVPHMDEHSFFFALLALALAVWAATAPPSRREALVWLVLPSVTLAGYLSKQVPAVFVPPIVVLVALRGTPREVARRLGLMAAGTLAMAGTLAALVLLLDLDLARLRLYFVDLPSEEGELRMEFFGGVRGLVGRARTATDHLDLLSIPLTQLAGIVAAASGLALWVGHRRGDEESRRKARGGTLVLWVAGLAWAVLVADLLFIALTNNQPEIGACLLFVSLGLAHLSLSRLALLVRPSWGLLARGAGLLLLFAGIADGWSFDRRFNLTRSANDYRFDPELAAAVADELPEGLRYLRWSVPTHYTYSPSDLSELVEFLSTQAGAFLLIGDTNILYGLTGKPSTLPSLWFHPRVTLPLEDDPRFAAYEDLVLESVRRHGVRFLVLEGERTWMHRKLEQFPRLAALVAERTVRTHTFGPFTVHELGDG